MYHNFNSLKENYTSAKNSYHIGLKVSKLIVVFWLGGKGLVVFLLPWILQSCSAPFPLLGSQYTSLTSFVSPPVIEEYRLS